MTSAVWEVLALCFLCLTSQFCCDTYATLCSHQFPQLSGFRWGCRSFLFVHYQEAVFTFVLHVFVGHCEHFKIYTISGSGWVRNIQIFHNTWLASTSYMQPSSPVTLSPSRSTWSLSPCYCLFLDDLWLTKSCTGNVISPTRICTVAVENEFGHLQTSLSSLRLTAPFYHNLLSWCFAYHLWDRGKGPTSEDWEWEAQMNYCFHQCCVPVRSDSQVVSDTVADVLQEHLVFVAWKAVVPHHVHFLILGIIQSLPTACGSSTGSPGWFRRLLLLPFPTALPKSPFWAARIWDWFRSKAHDRPYKALKILAACSTEIVIVQCLSQMMPCLLKAATPTQLIH